MSAQAGGDLSSKTVGNVDGLRFAPDAQRPGPSPMELAAAALTSGGSTASSVLDEGAAIHRLATTEDIGSSESRWGLFGGAVGVRRYGRTIHIIALEL